MTVCKRLWMIKILEDITCGTIIKVNLITVFMTLQSKINDWTWPKNSFINPEILNTHLLRKKIIEIITKNQMILKNNKMIMQMVKKARLYQNKSKFKKTKILKIQNKIKECRICSELKTVAVAHQLKSL